MASFNRVILVGNLTRDVEVRYIQSGSAVAEIGLAVNDRRKTASGEWVDETTFVDVTLWGRTAEIASEYLSKGSPVLVEGRLKLDTWETDGQKRSKLRVVGEKMQMLSARGPGQGGPSSGGGGGQRRQPQSAPNRGGGNKGGGDDFGGGYGGGDDYDSFGGSSDDIPF
ncbi:single-stranded DNA-binding protein [Blastopirellula sp. JC732]|uniref:Single-stranded DNA-binding protein n=1 Tax=Blastopirellula sediminis TaxID=2894196 RepID=A0A9X1MM32_9BACT|nr:single-stranded DNA-binding protein [Blastopirellula sediminis]MCC9607606.1 single-stranded DNA-binding protein [Blastopirellula sediminis]MCC9629101.1 single-stranded DNA-binding protein [Blastopirellula sediminis]